VLILQGQKKDTPIHLRTRRWWCSEAASEAIVQEGKQKAVKAWAVPGTGNASAVFAASRLMRIR
jgi:hypothetical protein